MEENSNQKNAMKPIVIIMAVVIIGLVFVIISLLTNGKENVENAITNMSILGNEEELVKEPEKIVEVDEEEEDEVVIEDVKDNEKVTNNNSKVSSSITSSDWKSGEFMIDGVAYKLNTDYKTLTNNGWYVDFEKLGYADGYILNKNDKTYSTVDLLNDKFDDAEVSIGFINLGESAKDVKECQFWAISVNNKYSDTPVNFE